MPTSQNNQNNATTRLFQKSLIAFACSLALVACGQKSEAPNSASRSEVTRMAPAATPSPAPAAMAEPQAGMQRGQKLMAPSAVAESVVTEGDVASRSPAGLSTGALTGMPALSAAGTKNRQLVITANARFRVKNTYASSLAIEDAVVASDGYVVSNALESVVNRQTSHRSSDSQLINVTETTTSSQLVVRVPSQKVNAFLREIANQVEVLHQRNVQTRDVQFDMLRSQLEAARNNEAQADLGQLTRQNGTIGDKGMVIEGRNIAKAQRDEARIAQAQLADQVSYSTLSLQLYQAPQASVSQSADFDSISNSHRPGFITKLGLALNDGWHALQSIALWTVAVWPLWLLLLALGGAITTYRSRKGSKQKAV